jgi:hypothetical protein
LCSCLRSGAALILSSSDKSSVLILSGKSISYSTVNAAFTLPNRLVLLTPMAYALTGKQYANEYDLIPHT